MIPIDQTKLHNDPPGTKGNCLAAAIASVLEIDIGSVPAFEEMDLDVWYGWLHCWLDSLGYTLDLLQADDVAMPDHLYVIAAGPSPRGDFGHVVVAQNGIIVHDPYPSGEGLAGAPTHYYVITRK